MVINFLAPPLQMSRNSNLVLFDEKAFGLKKKKFKVMGNCQMARTYLIKVSKWLNGRRKGGGMQISILSG